MTEALKNKLKFHTISLAIAFLSSCSIFETEYVPVELIKTPLLSPEDYTASIYYEYTDPWYHEPVLDVEILIGLNQSGEVTFSGKHYRRSKISRREFDRLLSDILSSDLWKNRKNLPRIIKYRDPRTNRYAVTSKAWDPEKEVYDYRRPPRLREAWDTGLLLDGDGNKVTLIVRVGENKLTLYDETLIYEIPEKWEDKLNELSGVWEIHPSTKK